MDILRVLVVIGFIQLCVTKADPCTSDGRLLLSPYIKEKSAQLARNLSRVNPEPFLGLESYSGFINVNEKHGSNLFFWFFPAEDMETSPWLIWLGGGPGITSLKGLFVDVGPLKVKNEQVKLRNITWASNYSMLFLDNPVGAGFSFTDSEDGYLDNEDDRNIISGKDRTAQFFAEPEKEEQKYIQVGAQMLEFLQQFLQIFPELQKAPLFVTGLSYAGKYVPALAIQIHRNNMKIPINLRGIAIGNGLVEPRNMMSYSQLCSSLGILDDEALEGLRSIEQATVRLADQGRMVDAAHTFNQTIEFIRRNSGVNIYDFRKDSTGHNPTFEKFLNQPKVRGYLHVGNATFNFNNQKVYKKMLPDFMNTTKPFIEELLEEYGVLSFSGQMDIIIAPSVSRNVYKTMDWSRRTDYVDAPRQRVLDEDGTIVAYQKSGGNFVDVLIRNAGHSAPADQPEVTKYILDAFIQEFMEDIAEYDGAN